RLLEIGARAAKPVVITLLQGIPQPPLDILQHCREDGPSAREREGVRRFGEHNRLLVRQPLPAATRRGAFVRRSLFWLCDRLRLALLLSLVALLQLPNAGGER